MILIQKCSISSASPALFELKSFESDAIWCLPVKTNGSNTRLIDYAFKAGWLMLGVILPTRSFICITSKLTVILISHWGNYPQGLVSSWFYWSG